MWISAIGRIQHFIKETKQNIPSENDCIFHNLTAIQISEILNVLHWIVLTENLTVMKKIKKITTKPSSVNFDLMLLLFLKKICLINLSKTVSVSDFQNQNM